MDEFGSVLSVFMTALANSTVRQKETLEEEAAI